jgi:indole-3-glycerol phosphate synthase
MLVTEKGIEPFKIDPEKLGLKLCTRVDLQGGDAKTNAMLLGAALTGSSPLSDTLVLNAGVGLFLYGAVATLEEGISKAKAALRRKSLKNALATTPHAILAEIKRASPSKGIIGEIPDLANQASQYVQGGAAAISVLTSERFKGTLEDLGAVAKSLAHTPVPILRKDFILEPIQIAQAAAHGADAVLLIATFLKRRTQEMIEIAKKIGLETIVEVHTAEELSYFQGAEIVAVNQRDLHNFSMHPETHEKLIGKIPQGALPLAASGVATPEDAARIFGLGYRALLVGEALTRSDNPLEFLSQIRMIPCS